MFESITGLLAYVYQEQIDQDLNNYLASTFIKVWYTVILQWYFPVKIYCTSDSSVYSTVYSLLQILERQLKISLIYLVNLS